MSDNQFSETHKYAAILQAIDVGLLVIDMNYEISLWNVFMESHSGIEPDDALGKNIFSLFPELDEVWFKQKVDQLKIIKNQAFTTWEQRPYILKFSNYRPITGNAPYMYQNATFIPIVNTFGEVDSVCVILYDVTNAAMNKQALEDASEQLFVFEQVDPHTLFNDEAWWTELLNYEFQRAQRTREVMTIAVFQIDTGTILPEDALLDAYLSDVVEQLSDSLRLTDKFARIDLHQISALLVATDQDSAKSFIDRITRTFNSHKFIWQGNEVMFKCDAGWAEISSDDDSASAWENRALNKLPNLFA